MLETATERRNRTVGVRPTTTVQVVVTDDFLDREEAIRAVRAQAAHSSLTVRQDDVGHLVLTLTLTAVDVWLAVLMALNAVTTSGCRPVAVHAEPTLDL